MHTEKEGMLKILAHFFFNGFFMLKILAHFLKKMDSLSRLKWNLASCSIVEMDGILVLLKMRFVFIYKWNMTVATLKCETTSVRNLCKNGWNLTHKLDVEFIYE